MKQPVKRRGGNTTGATLDETPTGERLVCYECGGQVDCCEFCDGETCPKANCRGCVIVTIGQEIPQVHSHGG